MNEFQFQALVLRALAASIRLQLQESADKGYQFDALKLADELDEAAVKAMQHAHVEAEPKTSA